MNFFKNIAKQKNCVAAIYEYGVCVRFIVTGWEALPGTCWEMKLHRFLLGVRNRLNLPATMEIAYAYGSLVVQSWPVSWP